MILTEAENRTEKVILIGVKTAETEDVSSSLEELGRLAETAGAVTAGMLIQNRESIHPGTYLGKGKIEELLELVRESGADTVIADDELSPQQMKNLAELLPDTKVIDRTILILDIFAMHAVTREGKLQIELAQLRYSLTRLSGYGRDMSRLGGGIGTRGPGETKLETDRRRIRTRITSLKRALSELQKNREITREKRAGSPIPVCAIVGYTNAGKSTLLNRLTDASVLSEDLLFATLDPTTRAFRLPKGETVLLTDTVGFISKLPHHLVEAFKSTLMEARYADIIIHVADASNRDCEHQTAVVYETLSSLGIEGKPVITLYNKCDLLKEKDLSDFRDRRALYSIPVSALTGEGIPRFLSALSDVLRERLVFTELRFDYNDAGKIQPIRKYGRILKEEYTECGIEIAALCPKEVYERLIGER